MLKNLTGYRTYIVSAIIFVLGGLSALGIHVPNEVYALLGSLGLAALRAAVSPQAAVTPPSSVTSSV